MRAFVRLTTRSPRGTLLVAVVLLLAALAYGLGVFGSLSGSGFITPNSESSLAVQRQAELFPDTQTDVFVVYELPAGTSGSILDAGPASAIRRQLSSLPASEVARTTDWWTTKSPALISGDRRATRVLIALRGPDRTAQFLRVHDELAVPGLTSEVGGGFAVSHDVGEMVEHDIGAAEAISLPIVLLLSLVIFGSLVSAALPPLIGAIAVVSSFAAVRLLTHVMSVSTFAINIITLTAMGMAIDYALFIVSRYREELGDRTDRESVIRAVGTALHTAGRAVVFSALIVSGAMASLLVFPQMFLRSMGLGGMLAVLIAMLASITVLPAVLVLLGPRIDTGRVRRPRVSIPHEPGTTRWGRAAGWVLRHPVWVVVGVVAALALCATPFLGVRWGGVDQRVLPESAPSRIASDTSDRLFGGATSSASVLVPGDRATVATYSQRLATVVGVHSVTPVAQAQDAGSSVTLVNVTWAGDSQTQTSQDLVRALRAVPRPDGTLIGGASAATVDLTSSIAHRLPLMAAVVVVVMLVLLFWAFGSVVLPIKAVVMAAISISASFGVVTWVFQEGHLHSLLRFSPPGYLDATQPILMLAILFGLSMDYEVFLLSRVREQWDRSGDNARAVVVGVERTGAIITSAALLLAVVIAGFSTSGIVMVKMIGIGMLVALLMDATIVRLLLVPATMCLLGRRNWWAPSPLARWWERHGHRES